VTNVDPILRVKAQHKFYNVSPLTLTTLLNDPPNVARNLKTYVAGLSSGATEVLEGFG